MSFLASCAAKGPVKVSYDTPEDTFLTWKAAARNMDMKALLDSYARSARPSLEQELARSSEEALKAMQKETRSTKFVIEKVVYEDSIAYLRVVRQKKSSREVEVLTMVKEGANWKLLP